jgi:hypothetical protein
VAVVFALSAPFGFPTRAGAPVALGSRYPAIRRRGDTGILVTSVCPRSTRIRPTW